MARLFGTDGVRGVANAELTPELAFMLGFSLSRLLRIKSLKTPRVLIGLDTRRSGHMLEAALTAGITSDGGEACQAGIMPTPGVAYLVKKYGMDAGAVISASHNPFLDNGIKFFDRDGHKMSDDTEDLIESIVKDLRKDASGFQRPVGGGVGSRTEAEDGLEDYINHVKSSLAGRDFKGMNITLDCSNGAAYKAAPSFFYDLGPQLYVIANEPDGENINLRCGSTHMDSLMRHTVENGSDAGIAFDGDGDRCLAVDETGSIVDGDQIIAILANYYKNKGELLKNTVVATTMSNIGLTRMCDDKGIKLERTEVGDKYVLRKMLDEGYMLGGEQSGHVINLKHGTTGDGLLTAAQLLMVMKDTGKKLSELAAVMEKYPQVLRNARVSNDRKHGYLTSAEIRNAIAAVEERFKGQGSVLIRPSGTEPLVRVMIEGHDLDEITKEADGLAALIEDVLL